MDNSYITYQVLQLLPVDDIRQFLKLSFVCKQWRELTKSGVFWKHFLTVRYSKSTLPKEFDSYYQFFVYVFSSHKKLTNGCKRVVVNSPDNMNNTFTLNNGDVVNYPHRYENPHVYMDGKLLKVNSFETNYYFGDWYDYKECNITAYSCPIFKFPEFPPAYWSKMLDVVKLEVNPQMWVNDIMTNLVTPVLPSSTKIYMFGRAYEEKKRENPLIYVSYFEHDYVRYEVEIMLNRNQLDIRKHILSGSWLYISNKEYSIDEWSDKYDVYKRIIIR